MFIPRHTDKYIPPAADFFVERAEPVFDRDDRNEQLLAVKRILSSFNAGLMYFRNGYNVRQYVAFAGTQETADSIRSAVGQFAAALDVHAPIRIDAELKEQCVLIEVPNDTRLLLGMSTVLNAKGFAAAPKYLLPIGLDSENEFVGLDMSRSGCCLVAGCDQGDIPSLLCAMALGMAYKAPPRDVRCIMIDMNGMFKAFDETYPYCLSAPVTDKAEAEYVVEWLTEEFVRRQAYFYKTETHDIDAYNCSARVRNGELPRMPRLVVFVSEYAELLEKCKDFASIAKKFADDGAACGICLVMATQALTPAPAGHFQGVDDRIAFVMKEYMTSHRFFSSGDAARLVSPHDVLVKCGTPPVRVSSIYLDDAEVEKAVSAIKDRFKEN